MVVFVCVGDSWVGSVVYKISIVLSLIRSFAVMIAFCVVDLVVIWSSSNAYMKSTLISSLFLIWSSKPCHRRGYHMGLLCGRKMY